MEGAMSQMDTFEYKAELQRQEPGKETAAADWNALFAAAGLDPSTFRTAERADARA